MDIKFGVAVAYHMAGATPDKLLKERFSTYDEADRYAEQYRDVCEPTIYLIVDNRYVFNCERSAVANEPYKVYYIKNFKEGQIETRVWWREFTKDPKKFLYLAETIIKEKG